MKYKRYTAACLLILLVVSVFVPSFAIASATPEITANNAIVVHRDSATVIYEKRADEIAYPASLTKLMTSLLIVEAMERGEVSSTDIVTASETFQEGLAIDGSTQNIQPGEEMTLESLLYCILVSSANEACNIAAEYLCGTVDAFVEKMNARAAELGCINTHFMNAHGLHHENHYTTARDVYIIAAEVLEHPLLVTVSSASTHVIPATNLSDERTLTNTNRLISNTKLDRYVYEYAIGGKTGSTTAAGYCLMSHAEKSDLEYICVVMGCTDEQFEDGSYGATSFSDSIALYNWAFDTYAMQTIASASDMIYEIPVSGAEDTDYVIVHPATTVTLLLPDGLNTEEIQRDIHLFSEQLEAPVIKGEKLGTVDFVYKGSVIASTDLLALTSVNAANGFLGSSSGAGGTIKTMITIIVVAVLILLFVYLALLISYNIRKRNRRKRRRKISSGSKKD